MSTEDQAPAPKMKSVIKTQVKGKDSSSGKPRYRDMVIDAITTQKERSGSSLGAIKNHLSNKYKVDMAKKAGTLNRLISIDCEHVNFYWLWSPESCYSYSVLL